LVESGTLGRGRNLDFGSNLEHVTLGLWQWLGGAEQYYVTLGMVYLAFV